MGTLVESDKKKDTVAVRTKSLEPDGSGGILKISDVTTVEPVKVKPQAFVVGMRIARGQRVLVLKFGGVNALDHPNDHVVAALNDAFPIPDGVAEQWVGFSIPKLDDFNPGSFESRFQLTPAPPAGQFQIIPIVAASDEKLFADGKYLVTASIVTGGDPKGPWELRR